MSVDLEYAHLLATTLMFKRFGDEVPEQDVDLLVKEHRDGIIVATQRDQEMLVSLRRRFNQSDLWLYLSDLDILRVKEPEGPSELAKEFLNTHWKSEG